MNRETNIRARTSTLMDNNILWVCSGSNVSPIFNGHERGELCLLISILSSGVLLEMPNYVPE